MIPGSQLDVKLMGVSINLYMLLREIGRFFSSQLLLGPFPLDPATTFVVDDEVPNNILDLLKIASYHGAIVRIDKSESDFVTQLRGGRFRLCFTLAPIFPLPLRVLGEFPLSDCLKDILAKARSSDSDGNYAKVLTQQQMNLL